MNGWNDSSKGQIRKVGGEKEGRGGAIVLVKQAYLMRWRLVTRLGSTASHLERGNTGGSGSE